MSVYGGFATRDCEKTYSVLVEGLIKLLSEIAMNALKIEYNLETSWIKSFHSTYR